MLSYCKTSLCSFLIKKILMSCNTPSTDWKSYPPEWLRNLAKCCAMQPSGETYGMMNMNWSVCNIWLQLMLLMQFCAALKYPVNLGVSLRSTRSLFQVLCFPFFWSTIIFSFGHFCQYCSVTSFENQIDLMNLATFMRGPMQGPCTSGSPIVCSLRQPIHLSAPGCNT